MDGRPKRRGDGALLAALLDALFFSVSFALAKFAGLPKILFGQVASLDVARSVLRERVPRALAEERNVNVSCVLLF
jgi:hypothetical protein